MNTTFLHDKEKFEKWENLGAIRDTQIQMNML